MSKAIGYEFQISKKVTLETAGVGSYIGATSATRLNSVFVPANTFGAGDVITVEFEVQKTATTSTSTFNLYYNTQDNLNSATLLSTRGENATIINIYGYRSIAVRVANGTGAGSLINNTTTGVATDFSYFASAPSTVAVNWTVDSYILLSGFASATDALRCIFLKVSK
jgi:hypothetical protein